MGTFDCDIENYTSHQRLFIITSKHMSRYYVSSNLELSFRS